MEPKGNVVQGSASFDDDVANFQPGFLHHVRGPIEVCNPAFRNGFSSSIDHFNNASLDERACTPRAGWPSDIGGAIFEGNTDSGSVHDGVFFSVANEWVFFLSVFKSLNGVLNSTRESIEARRADFSVGTYDHTTNLG